MELRVKCDDLNLLPVKFHESDAGYDLKSPLDITLSRSTKPITINMGISIAVPKNHMGLIVPRSSIGSKGVRLANTVGVIDSDYRGEIILKVQNAGFNVIRINKYDRIMQLIIVPVALPTLKRVENLDETIRGTGGFGSTNKKIKEK